MLTSAPSTRAEELFNASRPRSAHAHWQPTPEGGQLLVVNGSRIFDIERSVVDELNRAVAVGDEAVEQVLARIGLLTPPEIDEAPITSPPLRALSLAVAQKCNLGCTYCYAGEGGFGGAPKQMSWDTARRAIDLLVGGAEPGSRLNLAFLGGEPLANRAVVRQAAEFAAELAAAREARMTFSITTNGTLVTEEDAAFFEKHAFAVTVSLDGLRETHNLLRPFKGGAGSFDRVLDRVRPLLEQQRKMQVTVRATVTPFNLRLRESLDFFLGMGFHSVGFSPVLRSPTGRGELSGSDFAALLDALVECGLECERRIVRGERYAFANFINAMREIDRGTHRPYPCGAGAGYLGVSADGELAACHRFVGDEDGAMGDVDGGIDRARQNRWLAERHVHQQSPCSSCWARYWCSGGCHHEVIRRGRPACDFIRGWLHYSLQAYARLSAARPDWFDAPQPEGHAP